MISKLIFLGFALLNVQIAQAEICGKLFTNSHQKVAAGQPHLIIFSAPSGGGKTTLANLLLKEFPNLTQSISTTTRAPRGTEKDGVDYHFLSTKAFEKKISDGKFAEYAQVHGNYYGTQTATIRNAFAEGKSVIALVDVKGAENLRESFPDEIYTIFINPPDLKTLEARLRGRGTDPEAAIQKRLANAIQEMGEAKNFDQVVINDRLDRALGELRSVFQKMGLVPAQTP